MLDNDKNKYIRTVSDSEKDTLKLISDFITPDSNVLDIGAASGALGQLLTSKKRCTVDGIERDSELAKKAIEHYRRFHILDLEAQNVAQVVGDDRYDFIVLADVLEHLRDPDQILKQISGLLSDNGHFLLSVPNIAHAGIVASLLSGNFDYTQDGLLDSTHVRFFTRASVCEVLEKHGFEILSITPLEKDILETEFREYFIDTYPPALVRTLLAQPDALTYQFIIDAVYNPDSLTRKSASVNKGILSNNQLHFGCQLFWKSKGQQYSHERSKIISGLIGKDPQSLIFDMPKLEQVPESFRFDIADRPGLIQLHNMQLVSKRGDVLWAWNGDVAELAKFSSSGLEFLPSYKRACLLLKNDDSQLEINLPIDITHSQFSGATLKIELGWPMNADFVPAIDFLNKKSQHLDQTLLVDEIKSLQLKGADEEKITVLLQKLDDERKSKANLRLQLDEAYLSLENLEKIRKAMKSSFSWRLTAPLRLMGWLLRKIRNVTKLWYHQFFSLKNFSEDVCLQRLLSGSLDFPTPDVILDHNTINLSGWVFSDTSPVVNVLVATNNSPLKKITYGYERPDVFQKNPLKPESLKSGFMGVVSCAGSFSGKVNLSVWVELADGAVVKKFTRVLMLSSTPKLSSNFLGEIVFFLLYSAKKAWRLFREGRLPLAPQAWWLAVRRNYIWRFGAPTGCADFQTLNRRDGLKDPYQQWIETNRITPKLESLMRMDVRALDVSGGQKISIVVPVYNTPKLYLDEMIRSVKAQYYNNWELILIDDASSEAHIRDVLEVESAKDSRIITIFRQTNGHICEATNDGINVASGEYVALLDHDDVLPPDALLHIAECIFANPDVDWIYTDEDKIDDFGRRFDPQFKGEWNPEMAITHNYTHHLTVIRNTLLRKIRGVRKGYEGAQDLDLFLRVAEHTENARIRHIPQICYHWRSHEGSTASQGLQKTYIFDSASRAIENALMRRGILAKPVLPKVAQKHGLCLNQLQWIEPLSVGKEVTIVIPTKDRVDLLKRCISSLYKTVDPQFVRIVIVDDQSRESSTIEYFQELEKNSTIECKIVRPTQSDSAFNYARLINQSLNYIDTPYFLQLNNDVEAREVGWLEDMMGWLSIDGVGVVGARLLYPDDTVQHAGVVIGPHGGLADHQFHLLPNDDVGYLALPHAARDVTAVTGACMLTKTNLFKAIGGFDEENFAVEYNDVDFCLRVIESGQRIVYSPQATLTHITSASRGKSFNPQEHLNFVRKYKEYQDRFYNSNIQLESMWMPVNGENFIHSSRVKSLRILMISHTLSLTGAPIVAHELSRYFSNVAEFKVDVISLQDGPVRQMYEEQGIAVKVLTDFPNLQHISALDLQISLREIGNKLSLNDSYDVIIANTLTSFWGVALANFFKLPSIWLIHESIGVQKYAAQFTESSMCEMLSRSFLNANRVIFQANSTRAMYSQFDAVGNFFTIPGGLDLNRIEKFKETNSKNSLRNKYNIPGDSYVVSLIGTTCERKGQDVFLDALNLLQLRTPASIPDNVIFLLVGAVEGVYLDSLRESIKNYNLKNIHLIPETKEIYDYYGLSDVFVCSSHEESFSMVVLLAMAFELSIVSTNVFGIPEIVTDKQEACLVPAGDSEVMAEAIHQSIYKKSEGVVMGRRAYAKIHRLFDNRILHLKHLNLLKKVTTEEVILTLPYP